MSEETTIVQQLSDRFASLKDKVTVQRPRRIWAEAPQAEFSTILDYVIKEMRFDILCTITGLDRGTALAVIYHLARASGEVLNLSTQVPKEQPVLQSITSYFPHADVMERELVDLLGFDVQGLAAGHRYPLPDGWPAGQYPLRKEWKASMLDQAEAKS